jgi:aldose 1-epimerase
MPYQVSVNQHPQGSVILLENIDTGCVAEVFSFGAILNKFAIPLNGVTKNVVDGFENIADAAENITNGFKSAFLSPFPCRMNEGVYTHEEVDYKVAKFYLPPHAIHGIVYDLNYEVTEKVATDDAATVTLSAKYEGTDDGYPFEYTIQHKFLLKEAATLSLNSTITNTSKVSIPYAQGWHPYFSVADTVDDCTLQFSSFEKVVFDDTLIPTGEIALEEKFYPGTSLKGVELDNCFILDEEHQFRCTLQAENLALHIFPDESYSYIQVYTPPHRKSIAIENLSGAPDCFNNGLGLQIIHPGEQANFVTSYQLEIL